MSFLVRPAILTRSTGCLVHQQPFRHFSIASRALLQAGKSPQSASTALASHAPESKDRRATPVQVVGAELPAAEGPHYQGEYLLRFDLDRTGSSSNDRSNDGDDGQRAHSPVEDRRLDAVQSHLHSGRELAFHSHLGRDLAHLPPQEMNTVKIVHRPTQTVGDKVAHGAVKLLR